MPVTSDTVIWGCMGRGETNKENSFGYNMMEFANQYFTPKLKTACIEQNAILKHMVCTGIFSCNFCKKVSKPSCL